MLKSNTAVLSIAVKACDKALVGILKITTGTQLKCEGVIACFSTMICFCRLHFNLFTIKKKSNCYLVWLFDFCLVF